MVTGRQQGNREGKFRTVEAKAKKKKKGERETIKPGDREKKQQQNRKI